MKPLFTYGLQTLQFTSNLSYPTEEIITSVQVSEETNCGIPRVQTLGSSDIFVVNLTFNRLAIADRSALLYWLQSVVYWKALPFEYTNENGLVRTVRAWTTEFNFPVVNSEYATGTLPLRGV